MSPEKSVNKYAGSSVTQRKQDVRKHSRALQIAGGVVVAGVVLGFFMKVFFVVALVALVVAGVNAWKIKEIVNHKDQW
ncbi:MAG TPA: hypothetical protein DCL06_10955 [Corynebacterium variabile]|uniref:Uncharacterized protein n=1 Tax=Corynebacterium variabile TaxID=1727 RepID=A0A3B9QX56_9CORY|nr:hypothetical protein [Corynebacterium variabile]